MRTWLLNMMLFVSGLCFAQFSDEQLMLGYLTQDLSQWEQYIRQADWNQLSAVERTRLINYEYGFIPFQIDLGGKNCRQLLNTYRSHLEQHKDCLSLAQYYAYLSAAHAYEYKLDKSKLMSEGLKTYQFAQKALKADPNDPLALSLKGNIDFYAPKALGGSKKRALEEFLLAEKMMRKDKNYYGHLWNYPALQLCIAQCYEKMGDKEKALAKAKDILAEHPQFKYVKSVYLPQLTAK